MLLRCACRSDIIGRFALSYLVVAVVQYGSLPHILGLKGRLFMSKRAKVVTRMVT